MRKCEFCSKVLPSWEVHAKCVDCTTLEDICTPENKCEACADRSPEQWAVVYDHWFQRKEKLQTSSPAYGCSKSAIQRQKSAKKKVEAQIVKLDSLVSGVSVEFKKFNPSLGSGLVSLATLKTEPTLHSVSSVDGRAVRLLGVSCPLPEHTNASTEPGSQFSPPKPLDPGPRVFHASMEPEPRFFPPKTSAPGSHRSSSPTAPGFHGEPGLLVGSTAPGSHLEPGSRDLPDFAHLSEFPSCTKQLPELNYLAVSPQITPLTPTRTSSRTSSRTSTPRYQAKPQSQDGAEVSNTLALDQVATTVDSILQQSMARHMASFTQMMQHQALKILPLVQSAPTVLSQARSQALTSDDELPKDIFGSPERETPEVSEDFDRSPNGRNPKRKFDEMDGEDNIPKPLSFDDKVILVRELLTSKGFLPMEPASDSKPKRLSIANRYLASQDQAPSKPKARFPLADAYREELELRRQESLAMASTSKLPYRTPKIKLGCYTVTAGDFPMDTPKVSPLEQDLFSGLADPKVPLKIFEDLLTAARSSFLIGSTEMHFLIGISVLCSQLLEQYSDPEHDPDLFQQELSHLHGVLASILRSHDDRLALDSSNLHLLTMIQRDRYLANLKVQMPAATRAELLCSPLCCPSGEDAASFTGDPQLFAGLKDASIKASQASRDQASLKTNENMAKYFASQTQRVGARWQSQRPQPVNKSTKGQDTSTLKPFQKTLTRGGASRGRGAGSSRGGRGRGGRGRGYSGRGLPQRSGDEPVKGGVGGQAQQQQPSKGQCTSIPRAPHGVSRRSTSTPAYVGVSNFRRASRCSLDKFLVSMARFRCKSLDRLNTSQGVLNIFPGKAKIIQNPDILLSSTRHIEASCPRVRNSKTSLKRCNRVRRPSHSRLLQPPVRGPQEHGRLETGNQSLNTKQACKRAKVHHGNSRVDQIVPANKLMGSINRLEGRLLSCPSTQGIPQISQVRVQGGVSVPSSSFRSLSSSLDIHNGSQGASGPSSSEGHLPPSIFGRLGDSSPRPTSTLGSVGLGFRSLPTDGVHSQRVKVRPYPISRLHFRGLSLHNTQSDSATLRGPYLKNQEPPQSFLTRSSDSLNVAVNVRPTSLYREASPPRPSPYSRVAARPPRPVVPINRFPHPANQSVPSGQRQLALVVVEKEPRSGISIPPASAIQASLYGCKFGGLGGPPGFSRGLRHVGRPQSVMAHQPTGVGSCIFSSCSLGSPMLQTSSSSFDGQHHGDSLHKQAGRHQVPVSVPTSNFPAPLVSLQSHYYHQNGLCPPRSSKTYVPFGTPQWSIYSPPGGTTRSQFSSLPSRTQQLGPSMH